MFGEAALRLLKEYLPRRNDVGIKIGPDDAAHSTLVCGKHCRSPVDREAVSGQGPRLESLTKHISIHTLGRAGVHIAWDACGTPQGSCTCGRAVRALYNIYLDIYAQP